MTKRLLISSMSRGRDASGIVLLNKDIYNVFKKPGRADSMVEDPLYKKAMDQFCTEKTLAVIGHCRMQTLGTYKNNDNNHPIVCGDVVGVHNGVISNHSEMFNKLSEESALQEFKRKAQVDSEIIFKLIDFFYKRGYSIESAIKRTSILLQGSFACVASHASRPDILWVFKRNNPAVIKVFPKVGLLIVASANEYIQYAIEHLDIGEPQEITLDAGKGVCINLTTKWYNEFDLEIAGRRALEGSLCRL